MGNLVFLVKVVKTHIDHAGPKLRTMDRWQAKQGICAVNLIAIHFHHFISVIGVILFLHILNTPESKVIQPCIGG